MQTWEWDRWLMQACGMGQVDDASLGMGQVDDANLGMGQVADASLWNGTGG